MGKASHLKLFELARHYSDSCQLPALEDKESGKYKALIGAGYDGGEALYSSLKRQITNRVEMRLAWSVTEDKV